MPEPSGNRLKVKVGVLVSGRGSNLKALIQASQKPRSPFSISLVIANRPDAGALGLAEASGVRSLVVDHKTFEGREAFDQALDQALRDADIEIVCLAGFMRILTPWFVERWQDRLLNIHPSLLPAFKGLNTHARALEAGVRVHGCTVHLVRAALDDGPIVVQGVTPVFDGDTEATLAARVLEVEHRAYPLALDLMTSGRARLVDEKIRVDGSPPLPITWLNPTDDQRP
jgi:phosphoribosylglycinamide formyltransferase-1